MNNKMLFVMLILVFGVALGAGIVTGKLSSHVTPAAQPAVSVKNGTLTEVLKLSPAQRDQMQKIWEDVREQSNQYRSDAEHAQKERDDALMQILTDEQKAKYQKLTDEANNKVAMLNARREEAFKAAVAKTDFILDAQQREMYHQIIKDRVGNVPDGSWQHN